MPFVHSFDDTYPPARFDGVAWTRVLVEEAAAPAGPWAQIADQVIPVDATPATPDPVDITVSAATLEEGYYRFRFVDTAGTFSPYTDPVLSPGDAPRVDEVGALLRARTKDINGNEPGTFTTDTRPTGTQVEGLIEDARFAVGARVGDIPDELAGAARRVTVLGAALLVELSFFPEQVATGRSPYDQLKALYDQGLEALLAAIEDLAAGGDIGPGDDAGILRWSFDERPLIGPRSVL